MTRPGRPGLTPGAAPGPNWIDASGWNSPIDLPELFGDRKPVELEIGSGKGLFLLRESLRRPDVNFLGVEFVGKVAQVAAARCLKAGARNVRILFIDARRLLPLIADGAAEAIHVYFPDPWWKRRHRKRRIVACDVVEQFGRVLAVGGELRLATDVEEYYGSMLRTVGSFPNFVRLPDPPPSAGEHDLDYLTHFERKFRRAGKSIYHARYRFAGRRTL